MNRLYEKSEIWFAVIWIIIYVVGASITDSITGTKAVTLIYLAVLTVIAVSWMKKNGLTKKYGLCKAEEPASKFMYYIPLAVIVSCNLWFGVTLDFTVPELIIYMCSMVLVGIIEEIIFRGFLFRAMAKDSMKAAIAVSSITFGIGHVVNLFNSSGMDLIPNICQIVSAVAIGFLFVVIFIKSKSIIPCIATHSVLNALSVVAVNISDLTQIIVAAVLIVIALGYAKAIMKKIPV